MKTLIKYTSDINGKRITKLAGDLDVLPSPRVGDSVPAEGRPRQVSHRRFFLLGTRDSGVWDDSYSGFVEQDEDFVVIFLVG